LRQPPTSASLDSATSLVPAIAIPIAIALVNMGVSHIICLQDGILIKQSTISEDRWLANSLGYTQKCHLCLKSPKYNTSPPEWKTLLDLEIHMSQWHRGLSLTDYWTLLKPVLVELE
jgi:hypothetical protein